MNPSIDAPGASTDQGNSPFGQTHGQGFSGIESIRTGLSRTDHGQSISITSHSPLTKENQWRLGNEGQPAGIVVVPQGNGANAIKGKFTGKSVPIKNISFFNKFAKRSG